MALALLVALASLGLAGCSTLGFYQQAVVGQLRLLHARQDVAHLLAQADTEPELRAALIDSQAVLSFADSELGLKADGRYGAYVALEQPFVVWNLVVAPVDSVTPRTWCFPVAGCVSYRGYFDEAQAHKNALKFDAQAFDTYVGGVPAYSTLGWFDDPLLSSFIRWPQPARAELLFHELAHGRLYVGGDTAFNESFATFVAELALPLYLDSVRALDALASHQARKVERARFNALLLALRKRLEADFAALQSEPGTPARREEARLVRRKRYSQAAQCFASVSEQFIDARWAAFFEQPPNLARLSLVGAYHGWVSAFSALFAQNDRDLGRFYSAVEQLAELSFDDRQAELIRLTKALEQPVQAERDHENPGDIHCEALADHVADGDMAR